MARKQVRTTGPAQKSNPKAKGTGDQVTEAVKRRVRRILREDRQALEALARAPDAARTQP